MKQQEKRIINIGENDSKKISDYLVLFVKYIYVYYPEVECVIMKNYFDEEDNKLQTYLYYIESSNSLYDLKRHFERFDLKMPGDLKYEIVLNEKGTLDLELVNGKILFDRTKEYIKLQQNSDFINRYRSGFIDFKGLVDIEKTIDLERVKKLSR